MRSTPSRRGAVLLIIMKKTYRKFIVPAFVVLVFLLLGVRPVRAEGTVTPLSYTAASYSAQLQGGTAYYRPSYEEACAAVVASYANFSLISCSPPSTLVICNQMTAGTCTHQLTGFLGIGNPMSISCPASATVSGSTCACGANLMPNTGSTACVDLVTQASANATAAALAAGKSAAAAAAAAAAIVANSTAPYLDLPAIAAVAAFNYDFALAQGVSAADSEFVAAQAADLYANNDIVGLDALQRSVVVNNIVDTSISAYLGYLAAGITPSTSLVASVGAGALTMVGIGMAVVGAAPVATAIVLSGALHLGVIATLNGGAAIEQTNAGVSAGALAIQSGATPLQVTLAPQVVAKAVPVTATAPQIAAASSAAVAAMATTPISSWSVPAVGAPNNSASVAASTASAFIGSGSSSTAAAAAAAAAAQVIASGGTSAAANTAATAAAGYVTAGGTTGGAAVVGAQVGQQTDGATEGTLKGVLTQLTGFMTYGQGAAVNDAVVPGVDRVGAAQTVLSDGIGGLHTAAIAADETDEASLFGAFVFDPVYVACQPFTKTVMGKTWTIDLCSYAAMLRELLGWLFAVLGAYSIYQTIFKSRA